MPGRRRRAACSATACRARSTTAGIGALVALAAGRVARLTAASCGRARRSAAACCTSTCPRALPAGHGAGRARRDAGAAARPGRATAAPRRWRRGSRGATARPGPGSQGWSRRRRRPTRSRRRWCARSPRRRRRRALAVRHLSATPAGRALCARPRRIRTAWSARCGSSAADGAARWPASGRRARCATCGLRRAARAVRSATTAAGCGWSIGRGGCRRCARAGSRPIAATCPTGFDARAPAVRRGRVARARLSIDGRRGTGGARIFGAPAGAADAQPDRRRSATNLDLIRARAAMLFAEPGARRRRARLPRAERAGWPTRRGRRSPTRRRSSASRTGWSRSRRAPTRRSGCWRRSRVARGAALLLLGADVLPAGPRVAGALAAAGSVAARPVLGGTLLDTPARCSTPAAAAATTGARGAAGERPAPSAPALADRAGQRRVRRR